MQMGIVIRQDSQPTDHLATTQAANHGHHATCPSGSKTVGFAMSAFAMSAAGPVYPLIATKLQTRGALPLRGQLQTHALQQTVPLFRHRVGKREHLVWNLETE
jgi:hypothetical protein